MVLVDKAQAPPIRFRLRDLCLLLLHVCSTVDSSCLLYGLELPPLVCLWIQVASSFRGLEQLLPSVGSSIFLLPWT